MNTAEFDKRINENPYHASWHNSLCGFDDSITENGDINYNGLSDEDKLRLYVYAWNKAGFLPRKIKILKQFNWSESQFAKIRSSAGDIKVQPTFSEMTGLISGSGYYFETSYQNLNT